MTNYGAEVEAAAHEIRKARQSRVAIAPVAEAHGISGVEHAYAVASVNVALEKKAGHKVVGRKVGLTSKVVQEQLGVDQPDFGMLFDHMEYLSGDIIPSDTLIQPKVEAEVAFALHRDLDTDCLSWTEFANAISYVFPAIEVVDSVIRDWKITLEDTIADNASSALYVLAEQPVAFGGIDLGGVGMTLRKNGEICSVGSGASALGHPLRAAYWLAKTMAERSDPLRAGEIILSGALGPMVPVVAGDDIQVEIGGLGGCSVSFS
ncbi:hypothetical protein A3731_11850 [Roseovarius sp. HI0049]|nr:hypothetical protein A3731_11850 [Roseovarius sp. HI0049]